MKNLKLLYWLPISLLLTIWLGVGEGDISSVSVFKDNRYVLSVVVWAVSFSILFSLATVIGRQKRSTFKYIYLGAFLATLLLFYIDNDPANSLFFDIKDAGNSVAILMYGTLFFGLFSLVNFIEVRLTWMFQKD